MKSYKEYPKRAIGYSDISSLIVRSPEGVGEIYFGSDGSYTAYIVDGDAEIGSHYKEVYQCKRKLKIYDDDECTARIFGDDIRVYRAGEKGIIIQTINYKGEE